MLIFKPNTSAKLIFIELHKDVKRMLCTGGKDPIDESEIDQFLIDIGFEADKFVNINDFAQFLLEWINNNTCNLFDIFI